jgi:hypothetical protein
MPGPDFYRDLGAGAGPRLDQLGDEGWRKTNLDRPGAIRGLKSYVLSGSPIMFAEGGITFTVHSDPGTRSEVLEQLQLANSAKVGLTDIRAGESLAPLTGKR